MRYKRLLVPALALLLIPGMLLENVSQAAKLNTAALNRVTNDVRYLASEDLEGRGVDTKGIKLAADFIRQEFKAAGLTSGTPDGTFFQPFEVALDTNVVPEKNSLVLTGPDGAKLELKIDEDFNPLVVGGSGSVKAPLVFAGYGITADKQKYDDFANIDVKDKIVIVMRKEPQQKNPHSKFNGTDVTNHAYIRSKLTNAEKHGAAGVIFVNDPTGTAEEGDSLVNPNGFGPTTTRLPFAMVTQDVVNKLLESSKLPALAEIEKKIDEKLEPQSALLEGWTADLTTHFEKETATVSNVIGMIKGEGPLAEEIVVIGAHYDHLGYGGFGSRRPDVKAIHFGADDNASGTAALLEVARRIGTREKKPARTLVFMAFSAEERGLLGSNHYIANPLFPLDKTVAMLNFDMVGRVRNDELIVYGTGTAAEFDKLVDDSNVDGVLKLKKVDTVMGASDHYGFYLKEIPVFHFFSGTSKEYHTPDDTFDTINLEGIVLTVDLSEKMLDGIIGTEAKPTFQKVQTEGSGRRGNMAYLGVIPDYSGTTDGLKITGVKKDSPAEKGGLKADDVIIRFGDVEVTDIRGLATGLQENKAGQKVKIVVKRDGKEVPLDVTLGKSGGE